MLEPGTLRRQNKAAKAKSDALKELRYHLVLVSKSNATNRNELLAGLVTEFSGAVDDDTIRAALGAGIEEKKTWVRLRRAARAQVRAQGSGLPFLRKSSA